MPNALLHKAKDLKPGTRAAIEEELGRNLLDDEEISIATYLPHAEPDAAERRAAAVRLNEYFDSVDSHNRGTPDDVDAAMLEALRNARPGYRERK